MSKFIKNEDGTFNIILSDTEKIEWENEAKLYCECAEEHNTIYVKDYMGVRHGWICNKCKKFTQIG